MVPKAGREGEVAPGQIPVQEKIPINKNPEKQQVASLLRKYDKQIKRFHEMSRKMLHDPTVDATVFGLNTWELQAAEVIAIASIQKGLEQGKLQPKAIDPEVRKNVRKIGNSPEFKDWAEKVQSDPNKLKQLSRMAPEEVRMDFVEGMSKSVHQNYEQEIEGLHKNTVGKVEFKKAPSKVADPVI